MAKTRRFSKVIVALLVLAMLLTIMPVMALATYPSTSGAGFTVQFGDPDPSYQELSPEKDMVFSGTAPTFTADYQGPLNGNDITDQTTYYPSILAFYVTSGVQQISSITATGLTYYMFDADDATHTQIMSVSAIPSSTTHLGFALTLDASSSVTTRKLEIANSSTNLTLTVNFHAPAGYSYTSTGDYIPYAYMPAAGQFANEGYGTGGWGDIYNASGKLKVNTTTGVSLGYFGGSVVLKFLSSVPNDPKNPYGADFILYGNAFWNNSELGCVQVAQDNGNGAPGTWYTLAGSYYYTANTDTCTQIEYTNPQTEADSNSATSGTNVNFTTTPTGLTNDTYVAANNFHKHSFFPTVANYVTGTRALDRDTDLTFYAYSAGSGSTHSTLEFTSSPIVKGVTAISTVAGTFGYADYYPVKELGGHYAYNPYATSGIANANGYNNFVLGAAYDKNGTAVNASGGEPMDISWAVDTSGNPVYLEYIDYVRVYTGVAKNNGIFGEISTELCGVAKVEAVTNGVGTTGAPTITVAGTNITSLGTPTTVGSVTVYDLTSYTANTFNYSPTIAATGSTHIYVNNLTSG
ncbi:MAG: hypothetical protein IKH57_04315, partial [Clostridia bacterium]|nr:hypothetical protein [Clostridia bacterium]